jgi:hypothetical protein
MNDTAASLGEMRNVFPELEAADVTVESSAAAYSPAPACPAPAATCAWAWTTLPRFASSFRHQHAALLTTYPVEALGNYSPVTP